MKKRQVIRLLMGISATILFCLRSAAPVYAGPVSSEGNSLTLQNVSWKEEKPAPSAKAGYYQLNAAAGQGSITLLNDGYSHLTVTGYSSSPSFASLRGNQLVRGYTLINVGSPILRLRYDVSRHLLLACDGQEVFSIYPDSSAADGSGYVFSSTFGSFSADSFSHLPYYGICLEYSEDGRLFKPLETAFSVRALETDKKFLYQETHAAEVPENAAWLRIALSCAGQLANTEGELFSNAAERPMKVADICCTRSDVPSSSSSSSEPPGSGEAPPPSDTSSSSTSSDISFEEPSSSGTDTDEPDKSAVEDTSSDNAVSGGSSSGSVLTAAPSRGSGKEETGFHSSQKSSSFGRLTKESVYYTRESPSKLFLESSSIAESTQESFSEGEGGLKNEEEAAQENPSSSLVQEPEKKEGESPKETAAVSVNAVDLPFSEPEDPSVFSGPLVLYLSVLLFVAAFFIGRASVRSHKSKK